MAFNVQENAVFIHEFSKKSPYRRRGNPPPTPSPRSVASLPQPSLWPPVGKSWLHHCHLHS